jgi:hypothetical protein
VIKPEKSRRQTQDQPPGVEAGSMLAQVFTGCA